MIARLRQSLERHQVAIYFGAVAAAGLAAALVPALGALESAINAALGVMLFATFLQVPLAELGKALRQVRFLSALLVANFVVVPIAVALLVQPLPADPLLRLGVLLVLLTPCIDYVVTFAHLGRADAQALLAATPLLLGLQMLLLPLYLQLLLGESTGELIQAGPFLHAFVWLIVVPLLLAGLVQACGRRLAAGARAVELLGALAVPATAVVLFVVICAVVPQLEAAGIRVLQAVPLYLGFAILAPALGLAVGRLFRLPPAESRAVAFSAATRNSLVVLPLATAVPGALPLLPAVVVAQTLVELLSELVYVRLLPRFGGTRAAQRA